MRHRLGIGIVALALTALLTGPSFAAGDDQTPDATLRMTEGSVAVGIGWSWGRGEVSYKGKTYHFKIEGLSVAEVGMTNATATGNVYNLKSLDDFAGGYASAGHRGNGGQGRRRLVAAQRQGCRDQPEERDQGREHQGGRRGPQDQARKVTTRLR